MATAEAATSTNTYRAHRQRQTRRILDAALRLFGERGVDRVTMAEITDASGVRASTIYQYFSNKDEIVWAIMSELLADSAARASQRIERETTALGKITALFEFMADELSTNQNKVRFMAQFDAIYARDWPVERLLKLEGEVNPEGFDYFRKLIEAGVRDGSLRRDLDPDLTMHAVMNALAGAQRRLASLGKKVEQEYGQTVDRLFRETIRVILFGLRAPEGRFARNLRRCRTPAETERGLREITFRPEGRAPGDRSIAVSRLDDGKRIRDAAAGAGRGLRVEISPWRSERRGGDFVRRRAMAQRRSSSRLEH
jgi:AcrR family transcriptional regulator